MSGAAESKIGLGVGIPLAVGSILGSGILFLPSFTYALAGEGVLLSWMAVTVLCLLLVKVFFDMASQTGGEGALGAFLSLGLGARISKGLPLLLLGTVCLGMPASAYIVGLYVNAVFPDVPVLLAAFALIGVAVLANLVGVRTANSIQVGSIALVVLLSIGLAFFAMRNDAPVRGFDYSNLPTIGIIQGVAAAFWAYAGFENLSFVVRNFKNPKRDFLISMIVALLVTGAVYMLVTFSYMQISDETDVSSLTSLLSLAAKAGDGNFLKISIAVLAYSAVLLNFISWIWGMSKMVGDAANEGLLPSVLRFRGENYQVATTFLGVVFLLVATILTMRPAWVENVLVAVSINFVFVYVLLLASYVLWLRSLTSVLISGILLMVLIPAIASFGFISVYPIILLTAGVIVAIVNARNGGLNGTADNQSRITRERS